MTANGSSVATLIWTVTFRVDSKSPQQELVRYTEEAADNFAQGILDMGGVAVVVESLEERSVEDDVSDGPIVNSKRSLEWP